MIRRCMIRSYHSLGYGNDPMIIHDGECQDGILATYRICSSARQASNALQIQGSLSVLSPSGNRGFNFFSHKNIENKNSQFPHGHQHWQGTLQFHYFWHSTSIVLREIHVPNDQLGLRSSSMIYIVIIATIVLDSAIFVVSWVLYTPYTYCQHLVMQARALTICRHMLGVWSYASV